MSDRPFRDEPTEVLETALGLADTHARQAARFQPEAPGDELPAVADLFRTELQHREGTVTVTNPPADVRRDRYAQALVQAEGFGWDDLTWENLTARHPDEVAEYRRTAEAVMAVADAEQQELRTENTQLHRWHDEDRTALAEMRSTIERLRREKQELGELGARRESELIHYRNQQPAVPSAPADRGGPGTYYCDDCDHAFAAPTDTESCICSCGTRAWREKPADEAPHPRPDGVYRDEMADALVEGRRDMLTALADAVVAVAPHTNRAAVLHAAAGKVAADHADSRPDGWAEGRQWIADLLHRHADTLQQADTAGGV